MNFIKNRIFLSIVPTMMVLMIACWPVILEKITFNRLFSDNDLLRFRVVNKENGYFSSHYQIEVSNYISPYDSKYISAQFDVTSYPSWFSTSYNITSSDPDFNINLDIETAITGDTELSLLTDTIEINDVIAISPIRLKATLDNDHLNYDMGLYQITIGKKGSSYFPQYIWRNIQLSGNIDSLTELTRSQIDVHIGKVLSAGRTYKLGLLIDNMDISIQAQKDDQDKVSTTTQLSIDKITEHSWPMQSLTLQYTLSDMDYSSLKEVQNQMVKSLNTSSQDIVTIVENEKNMTRSMDDFLSHGLHFSLNTFAFEKNDAPFETHFTATLPSGHDALFSNHENNNIWRLFKGDVSISASKNLLDEEVYLDYAVEQLIELGPALEQDGNIIIEVPLQDIYSNDDILHFFFKYLTKNIK